MMRNVMLLLISICLAISPLVLADYVATGEIKGNICKGFIIESCRMVPIAAVEGKDGNMYRVNRRYPEVDDYNDIDGLCWIQTKSKGLGLWSSAANALTQPSFFTKNEDGDFEEVDVEYIVFPCEKR